MRIKIVSNMKKIILVIFYNTFKKIFKVEKLRGRGKWRQKEMEKDTPRVPHVPMAYWGNSPIV